MTWKLIALTALLVVASCRVNAQSAAQPELINTMTLESLQAMLKGMGFECTRDTDAAGKPEAFLVFQAEGHKVNARVPSKGYIWLYNIFIDKLPLEAVNEWNQNNNFNHAYISKDGKLFFDTDIVVSGGVTRENVEAQIREFRDAVGRWARFVVDHMKAAAPGGAR